MATQPPEQTKDSTQNRNNLKFWVALEELNARFLLGKTAAPAVTDDFSTGVAIGAIWVDETNDNVYICTDNASGAANWVQIN